MWKQGDIMLAGREYGRVRAMIDERGKQVKEVGPSMPVEVLGLSGTPTAGDEFIMKGQMNRRKNFLDGTWKNKDLVSGSFYLEKQKIQERLAQP